jgi:hypothetical protein
MLPNKATLRKQAGLINSADFSLFSNISGIASCVLITDYAATQNTSAIFLYEVK